MFTGIVQSLAAVLSIKTENNLSRLMLCVDNSASKHLEKGASVSINGVCLTAVEFGALDSKNSFISFDVIDETLRVTNLAELKANTLVNLERSLKAGDELGGHFVSGHIHCQGTLIEQHTTQTNCELVFQCDLPWMKYVLAKGFISINGTSLTVGKVSEDQFSVHLIPETLTRTNLSKLEIGHKVNLEFDQQTMTIVSTIERMNVSQ